MRDAEKFDSFQFEIFPAKLYPFSDIFRKERPRNFVFAINEDLRSVIFREIKDAPV